MSKTTLAFIAAVGWFITSIILLTIPGTAFPQEDWLDKIWFDKWVHIGMFSLLVTLWCLAIYLSKGNTYAGLRRIFCWIAIIFFAYGLGMEFVQKNFVPLRSFDGGDVVADAVGCAVGLIFSLRRYIKK